MGIGLLPRGALFLDGRLVEVVEVEGGDFAVGYGEFLEDVGAGRGGFDFPEVGGSVGGVEGV